MEAKLTIRFKLASILRNIVLKLITGEEQKMKKCKIKRTKGMTYKNYIKEEYDVIFCYKCSIKVSYLVICLDKLSRKVKQKENLTLDQETVRALFYTPLQFIYPMLVFYCRCYNSRYRWTYFNTFQSSFFSCPWHASAANSWRHLCRDALSSHSFQILPKGVWWEKAR